MVQDEVRWLLATIAAEWPGGGFEYEDVVRIDFDEPEILETGDRRKGAELSRHASITALEGDRAREPVGTEFHYDVETILGVRIEGVHTDAGGTFDSKNDFRRLVKYTQAAIDDERTYPSIDADDEVGFVEYLDGRIENENSFSNEYGDEYRVDFDVRLRGRQDPDSR